MRRRFPPIALHGFLGSGADWEFLAPEWAPSFFDPAEDWVRPYGEWLERFTGEVRERFPETKPWLVGYSMGGRLAMHALALRPELFSGGVIISAHPGFSDSFVREQARAGGEGWARRFESDEPWAKVIAAWNALDVLQNSEVPERAEPSREERQAYARALRDWSVGLQEDLKAALLPMIAAGKVHWVAGEKDAKYVGVAREMAGESAWIVPGAGHRVPWDAREELKRRVGTWCSDEGSSGSPSRGE